MPDVAIGIDLAWTDRNASGLCAMERAEGGWRVTTAEAVICSNAEIIGWMLGRLGTTTVVAVDAPLWIPNETGARDCDRQVISQYHPYKIGVYPCNRVLFQSKPRSQDMRRRLIEEGFKEAPGCGERVYFETYPHPAIVNLLRLTERVRYKKGLLASRQKKLGQLATMLLQRLPSANPPLLDSVPLRAVLSADFSILPGPALKLAEDRVDALVCAYCAASWLDLGDGCNERIGEPGQGMMVFPRRLGPAPR